MSYLDIIINKMQYNDEPYLIHNTRTRKFLRLPEIKHKPVLIKDFELHVDKGKFISLVGESGAGKTTLLRIVAGLEKCYEGSVALEQKPIVEPSRRIQIVFQNSCLLPWQTVEKNVAFAVNGLQGEEKKKIVRTWLQNVNMLGKEKDFPKTLSGGEESRVAFARTFVDRPELLLLDEPFRSIDLRTKCFLQDNLRKFVEDNSTTVILVSHSIDDAVLLSDYVYHLSKYPMKITDVYPIDVPRPRRRGDERLIKIATQIGESMNQ